MAMSSYLSLIVRPAAFVIAWLFINPVSFVRALLSIARAVRRFYLAVLELEVEQTTRAIMDDTRREAGRLGYSKELIEHVIEKNKGKVKEFVRHRRINRDIAEPREIERMYGL